MTGGRVSGLKKVGGSSLEPPASGQRLFRNLLLCLLLHCLLCGSARARPLGQVEGVVHHLKEIVLLDHAAYQM